MGVHISNALTVDDFALCRLLRACADQRVARVGIAAWATPVMSSEICAGFLQGSTSALMPIVSFKNLSLKTRSHSSTNESVPGSVHLHSLGRSGRTTSQAVFAKAAGKQESIVKQVQVLKGFLPQHNSVPKRQKISSPSKVSFGAFRG